MTVSYDLYFRSPQGSPTQEAFSHYFRPRPNYEVGENQAWYSNEDTGVYFSFEYTDGDDAKPDEEEDPSLTPLSFNMNYFRPHSFGLEAEPEVAAFVERFGLAVSDPQNEGMGDGEYSAAGFLRGWNAGNAFGYRAVLAQDPDEEVLTLPAARIETYWRWNRRVAERQEALGEQVFVPRIMFFDVDGAVRSAVAWTDGIPILLPEVDLVIVPREQLAPRRWLRPKSDIVVFNWDEIRPLLRHARRAEEELPRYEFFHEATPSEIEQLFRAKVQSDPLPRGVPIDQVLDEELVEQARA